MLAERANFCVGSKPGTGTLLLVSCSNVASITKDGLESFVSVVGCVDMVMQVQWSSGVALPSVVGKVSFGVELLLAGGRHKHHLRP